MARLTTVNHNRKERNCAVCRLAILIGDPYKWVHPRYRTRVDAHLACDIPMSMTSSSKMVPIWEGQEAYAKIEVVTDKKADAEMLAGTIREIGEEYCESASNIQEHFPDSEKAQELEDKGNALIEWADEIETAVGDISDDGPEDDEEVQELRAKVISLEADAVGEHWLNERAAEEEITNDDGETLSELEDQIEQKLDELADDGDCAELDDLVQNCPE